MELTNADAEAILMCVFPYVCNVGKVKFDDISISNSIFGKSFATYIFDIYISRTKSSVLKSFML